MNTKSYIPLKYRNPADIAVIRELKSENLKLQKKIAKLEVKNLTYKNRITVLEKERDPYKTENLSAEELATRLAKLLHELKILPLNE